MQRFAANEIGTCRGDLVLVSDFDTQGPMWTAEGDREVRGHVAFSERFLTPPMVQLSVSMWDLDTGVNQRGDLAVDQVTAAGFDVVFRTWGDTRVARLRVGWMAIGALPDEHDFAL